MEKPTSPLPIACALTPEALRERRVDLLPGLAQRALERRDITDGIAWRFEASPELLRQLADVIAREHACCPFLRFELTVEPGDGPVWLRVSGPPGTREFLGNL
jgi:hypothetical protein